MPVFEVPPSRRYAFNLGVPKGEREFIVSGATTEADVYALFGNLLPASGDAYPSTTSGLTQAFDFTIVKMPDSPGMWRVNVSYKTNYATNNAQNPANDKQPSEVGYRSAKLNVSAQFVDMWRNPTTTTQTSPGDSTNADIGGTSIDVAGIPVSALRYQQAITITVTDQFLPNPQQIAAQIGARNISSFLNYPVGMVVFVGCNMENVPEVGHTSVEYNFLFDAFYHLIQFPVRVDGETIPRNAAAVGNVAAGSASTVYWRQPFPGYANFSLLSNYFDGL